jgi:signal recognition particle subunit SRP54
VGEKLTGLEVFSAERLAGRILGMGDVVGLVEKAQQAVSQSDAERLAARMRKSEFTLEDFLEQMRSVRKLGSLEDLMKMMPGMPKGAMSKMAPQKDKMKHYEAILLSMTLKERRSPRLLDGSRRRRIAAGSGTSVPEVNRLLKDFEQAKLMMKALKKGPRGLAGLRSRMR